MKAKFSTRYISQNRTDLSKAVPLDTPIVVFFDPSTKCHLACNFCPCGQAHKELWRQDRQAVVMPFELAKKIIDDLTEFPHKINTLRFYKDGEPLMNKRLPDIIGYANKRNIAERYDFTTNAVFLTPERSAAIVEAGLTRIIISVNGLSEERYREDCGVKINFNRFVDNIAYFYEHRDNCTVFVKTTNAALRGESEEKFYSIFGDICDEIAIENISPIWAGFGSGQNTYEIQNDNIFADKKAKDRVVCPFILYQLCYNADGTASACFDDWNHQLIVGDGKTQSAVEIWNGEPLRNMQLAHLSGKRNELSVCRNCKQLIYCATDNVDDSREAMRQRYTRQ